jgi:2-polyprenyl-6-methoxyphenol hydroxylase-like FAD-dependent oxidoreductase
LTREAVEETEVLVLGAGPVGMFAGLCLAERGVRVRIVDQYTRTALRSYALALHPQSLRLFAEAGLDASLAGHAHFLDGLVVHHDGGAAEIDFAPVRSARGGVAVLPQYVLEAALEKALAERGVGVEWGQQLLTFDDGAEGVVALVASGAAATASGAASAAALAPRRVGAEFLVGADGGESMARRLLRIGQVPAGPPMTMGLMEFEAPLASPHRMQLVLADRRTDVLWPLAAERGRWSVQLDGDEPAEVAELRRHIRARAPWFGDRFGAADWVTAVSFEMRLARRFGRGRVWLAGDAAHFTSPIGAQSMNVGLREAHDLARRLAAILREGSSPRLLDYYNEERLREWKMLLGLKERLRLDRGAPAWVRAAAPRLVRNLPASGHDLNLLLEQVGARLYWLRGRRAGHVAESTAD